MRAARVPTILVAALLSLFAAGCGGDDIDTMPKAFLALINDTTAALKEITDEQTALAAAPKLRVLAERKVKLDEQAKTTKISKDAMAKSDEKYAQPMKEAGEKMMAEMVRIATANPKAAEITATSLGMR